MVAVAGLLGVLLVLPASAGADHPGIETHGDPVPPSAAVGDQIAAPSALYPVRRPEPRALPSATCSPVSTTTDDTTNASYPAGTPVMKVIYAYAQGDANDFASEDAAIIQAGARAVSDYVMNESGGQFSIRFDLGTSQGSSCLDVQTIALPQTAECYALPQFCPAGSSNKTTFQELDEDIRPRLGTQGPGPRNFVVYVDDLSHPGLYGQAGRWSTQDPSAGSLHNSGGLTAMLYGREGTDFFGSTTPHAAGTTSWNHVEFALHEISHTLGAVGPGAPHTSGAGHCNDDYDVLCYDDGGPGAPFLSSACDGANPPVDPYGPANQAWDCGKDDYFGLNPAPGSYLGVNWNIANSVFLQCEAASCTRPGVRPLPTTSQPASTQPDYGAPAKKKKKKKKKRKRK